MKVNNILVPIFKAYELETGAIIEGYYYREAGYFMSCGKPDLNRPVNRDYIVDENGSHRETAPHLLIEKVPLCPY